MKNTTFKQLLLASLLIAMSPLWAASADQNAATGQNDIYIEQIGSSNTIAIEQVGGSNKIGGIDSVTPSSTNYATINGSSNQVSVTQTGDNNLAQYSVLGSNNTYASTVTGYDNVTKLAIGDSTHGTNLRNHIVESIAGDTNNITQTIIGNDNTSSTVIAGSRNVVTKNITTSNAQNSVSLYGNDNQVYSEQTDTAGGNGHTLVLTATGSYNTYSIQQQGTVDTNVNISTTGSHNTITVHSSNSAIVNPLTAVAR